MDERPKGLARHVEGWQAGAVVLLLAFSTAALVVPRPVEELELPVPRVDPRELAAARAEDERLAALARGGLPFDVRRLGDAVRAFGRAEEQADEGEVGAARHEAGTRLLGAMREGAEKVAALRAYQLEAFLRELRAYLGTGAESAELHALGGAFVRQAREAGWLEVGAGRRALLLPDGALRALYKRRWNQIVGLEDTLAPTAAEQRALLELLLRRPLVRVPDVPAPEADRARARQTLADEFRLRKLDELARLDPAYPRELARGVLFYRLGRFPLAVESFRRHLEAHPDGPFSLRATNYLRTALERASEEMR